MTEEAEGDGRWTGRRALIACGDRNADWSVWRARVLLIVTGVDLVIHGDQRGIDALVQDTCTGYGVSVVPMPFIAALGPNGGPARNRQMVAIGRHLRTCGWAVEAIGFHDAPRLGGGTWDCLSQADQAGFQATVIRSDGSRTVMVFDHQRGLLRPEE